MYLAFAEEHESLSSFQNEGEKDEGLLPHFAWGLLASGRGISRAVGIEHSASLGVAWLQQVGNGGQEKPVSQQSPFPAAVGYSCKQQCRDQKMLPSLPCFIWGIAGAHPAAMAGRLCCLPHWQAGGVPCFLLPVRGELIL